MSKKREQKDNKGVFTPFTKRKLPNQASTNSSEVVGTILQFV
jgi:hypothetical protein